MSLTLVITDAGRAAITAMGGTGAVTITECGLSETAIVAAAGDTDLTDEFKRVAAVGGIATAADQIHVLVRDDSSDDYSLRSFALYLDDGTLFALYGQADPILEKAAASILLMALDIALTDIDAGTITFGDTDFIDPAATEDTAGVLKLATEAAAIAGTEADTAITPATLAATLAELMGPHVTQLGERKIFYRQVAESAAYKFPNGQHLALPAYQAMADALAGDPFLAADDVDKAANPGKWRIAGDGTYLAMPDMRGQFERLWHDDLVDGVARPGLGVRKANQNKSHSHDVPTNRADGYGDGYIADSDGSDTPHTAATVASGGDEAVPDHTAVWVLVRVA